MPPRGPMTCSASAGCRPSMGGSARRAGVDAVAAKREAGAAAVDDHGRKHAERMSPNALLGRRLLRVADVGQFADEAERIVVAEREMIDPIDQPRAGELAQLIGQLLDRPDFARRTHRSCASPSGRPRAAFSRRIDLARRQWQFWWPAWIVPRAADGAEIAPLFNYTANTGVSR